MKKATISILSSVVGAIIGTGVGATSVTKTVVERKEKEAENWKLLANKHMILMQLFNQWMVTKQEGKSIVEYFDKENIKSIAIYGMGYVGERLYDELKSSTIEVRYAIDKNADVIYSDIEIVAPDDELDEVDAIVVTPVFYFDEIEEMLSERIETKIVSFEDVLYEL